TPNGSGGGCSGFGGAAAAGCSGGPACFGAAAVASTWRSMADSERLALLRRLGDAAEKAGECAKKIYESRVVELVKAADGSGGGGDGGGGSFSSGDPIVFRHFLAQSPEVGSSLLECFGLSRVSECCEAPRLTS
ncbi:unnamed protein product, partial [Phaeothamnion confervicola]